MFSKQEGKDNLTTATIATVDYEYIQQLVRERSGIVLEEDKQYLVDARLTPLLRQEKLSSIQDLVVQLRAKSYNGLHQSVIEAMTTNETLFFRDAHPFEALKSKVFPDLLEARGTIKQITIWCAASSSGQEPYSIAMLAKEFFALHPGWSMRIIATDLSRDILARAKQARYSQLEVNRGLPATYMVKYFKKEGMEWQLNQEIRNMVEFREMNLTAPWPAMPTIEIIFLRNVLIYFDVEMKKSILAKARGLMSSDSYLFLGGAETTLYLDNRFEQLYYGKAPCCRLRKS